MNVSFRIFIRYILASLASSIAAVFCVLMTMVLLLLAEQQPLVGVPKSFLDLLLILGMSLLLGGMLALPSSLFFGGAVSILVHYYSIFDRWPIWLTAGAVGALPIYFFARSIDYAAHSIAFAIYLVAIGVAASATFRVVWKWRRITEVSLTVT